MNIGKFLITFGFLIGIGSLILYSVSSRVKKLLTLARWLYIGETIVLLVSSCYLMYLLIEHRFEFKYVYDYSSSALSIFYLISAFWAGHEGSFLLWALIGSLIGILLIKASLNFESWVMLFWGLIQFCLIGILVKAGPFEMQHDVPLDGKGLNPLLQDPWMIIHPPVLFFGYVLLAVPFCFALAGLVKKDTDSWVRLTFPWVGLGSLMLGAGNIFGAYWAYKTLGWGGYWGWDPVENSSLVPWLLNIGLLHGLLLQRKKEILKRTNLLLAIFEFILVIYGTFLTRSGVLSDFSVHSFVDLGITNYLIGFMGMFTIISIILLVIRNKTIKSLSLKIIGSGSDLYVFLALIVFIGMAFFTLLGTSAPLITRVFGKPSNVSISYYKLINSPLAVVLAGLLGFALSSAGRRILTGKKTTTVLIIISIVSGISAFLLGIKEPISIILVCASTFSILGAFIDLLAFPLKNLIRAGAALSHLGFGFLLLGALASSEYGKAEKINLTLNESSEVLGYTLTYMGIKEDTLKGKNSVLVEVQRGKEKFIAKPRLYFSEYNQGIMRAPSIRRYFLYDLYLSPVQEYEIGGLDSVILAKSEEMFVNGLQIKFLSFNVSHSEEGENLRVGANLEVSRNGEVLNVIPEIKSKNGEITSKEVLIEEFGKRITLAGVDADGGRVLLEVSSLKDEEKKEYLAMEVNTKPLINIFWLGTTLVMLGLGISLIIRFIEIKE